MLPQIFVHIAVNFLLQTGTCRRVSELFDNHLVCLNSFSKVLLMNTKAHEKAVRSGYSARYIHV